MCEKGLGQCLAHGEHSEHLYLFMNAREAPRAESGTE